MSCSISRDVPLQDDDAVTAADVVGNLSGEAFVVEEEEIELPDVADQELLEAVGEKMTGLSRDTMSIEYCTSS